MLLLFSWKKTLGLQPISDGRINTLYTEARQKKSTSSFLKDLSREINFLSGSNFNQREKQPDSEIQNESDQTVKIISQAIDLFSAEKVEYPTEESYFSLRNLVQTIFEIYLPKARANLIDFQLDFSPSFPSTVIGDPRKISQIIILLIDNAIEFTSEGSISVTCFFQNQNLIINVADTGKEIPHQGKEAMSAERQSTIPEFDTSQRKSLIIARSIIRSLQGNFLIKSEQRMGSILTIHIPIKSASCSETILEHKELMTSQVMEEFRSNPKRREIIAKSLKYMTKDLSLLRLAAKKNQVKEIRSILHGMKGFPAGFGMDEIYLKIKLLEGISRNNIHEPEKLINCIEEFSIFINEISQSLCDATKSVPFHKEDQTSQKSSARKSNILVAEDNPMNQEMIAYLLEVSNFKYRMVENGSEVIQALQNESFDLLLLDMQMPVMDGISTIKRLRNESRWNRLPVIAVTAQNMDEDELIYKNAGCDDFVAKPIDINELTQKINRLLNDSSRRT